MCSYGRLVDDPRRARARKLLPQEPTAGPALRSWYGSIDRKQPKPDLRAALKRSLDEYGIVYRAKDSTKLLQQKLRQRLDKWWLV